MLLIHETKAAKYLGVALDELGRVDAKHPLPDTVAGGFYRRADLRRWCRSLPPDGLSPEGAALVKKLSERLKKRLATVQGNKGATK